MTENDNQISHHAGMKTVAIIDYGMGNLRSVAQAALHVAQGKRFNVLITDDPKVVQHADRIILPGQGAMPECMRKLHASGLLETVLKSAQNKPLLCICVGMQMLLDGSEEASQTGALTPSLGLIAGSVKRFALDDQLQADGHRYKVPQIGWNQVKQTQAHPLWQNIPDNAWFYFVHSYYACPNERFAVAGETRYGVNFASAITQDNIFATQFHPEKSTEMGLMLYRNFLNWKP